MENNVNPAISIVMATRGDKAGFLRRSLESIGRQTFQDYEVVIVSKVIPQVPSSLPGGQRITFIQEKGKTLGAARNLGVKNAVGHLVSFLDDDAEAPENWLEKIYTTFSSDPSLCCLGGPHLTPVEESKKDRISLVSGLFGEAHMQKDSFGKSAIGKIAGCNVTYKKSTFMEFGCLNEQLKTCEDWELNRRLVANGCSLRYDKGIIVWHHRQGLRHVFQASSRSAPFYLSWETLKLARYESLIASFYITNVSFIALFVILLISPLYFLLTSVTFFVLFTAFTTIKTKTYNRRIIYFPLIVLPSFLRIMGFYFGVIKHGISKLQLTFSR